MLSLITGFPRSGTTYMANMIAEYGNHFVPLEAYCDLELKGSEQPYFYLNEPSELTGMCGSKPESIPGYLRDLRAHYKKEGKGPHLVMKHFGILEYPDVILNEFDRVIICTRPYKSWIKSATQYPATRAQAERLGVDNCFEVLYNRYKDSVDTLMEKLDEGRYIEVPFNSNVDLFRAWGWMGAPLDLADEMADKFKGSRWE